MNFTKPKSEHKRNCFYSFTPVLNIVLASQMHHPLEKGLRSVTQTLKEKHLGQKSWPAGFLSQFWGQHAQNMSAVEINATRMEREEFFSPSDSVHLGTFTLAETRPEGLAKKRVGQQEQRIVVAADACGLDTHGPLCVRSRTVKRPN